MSFFGHRRRVWVREIPSVERVRPAYCARCRIGSRPVGGCLQVVGHGLRDRQLRGCIGADEVSPRMASRTSTSARA
jgi:hypothetical protein